MNKIEQLKELKTLLDNGVLSIEEFELEKKKILNSNSDSPISKKSLKETLLTLVSWINKERERITTFKKKNHNFILTSVRNVYEISKLLSITIKNFYCKNKNWIFIGSGILAIAVILICIFHKDEIDKAKDTVIEFVELSYAGEFEKASDIYVDSYGFVYNVPVNPENIEFVNVDTTVVDQNTISFDIVAYDGKNTLNFKVVKKENSYTIKSSMGYYQIDVKYVERDLGVPFVFQRKENDTDAIQALALQHVKDAMTNVEKFIKNISNSNKYITYYPRSKNFDDNVFQMDFDSVKIQKIEYIPNNNSYTITCGDVIFYVKASNGLIYDSKHVYNYQSRAEYVTSIGGTLYMDLTEKSDQAIYKIFVDEEERVEIEQKRLAEIARKRIIRARYESIGLVITNLQISSGKDKYGAHTTGINFSVFNPTSKTIKYVIAEIQGVNRFDDPVTREVRCRGIGPVEPYRTGSFDFSDALEDPNNVVDDIKGIFYVVYTNGSSKTVSVREGLADSNFSMSLWYE